MLKHFEGFLLGTRGFTSDSEASFDSIGMPLPRKKSSKVRPDFVEITMN